MKPMTTPRVLTEKQFCDAYHVSRTTAWRMRRDGNGPTWYRFGGRVLYDCVDADRWLATHRVANPSDTAQAA